MIFGYVWKNIVFVKGFVKFREMRNIEDLMKFVFKLEFVVNN